MTAETTVGAGPDVSRSRPPTARRTIRARLPLLSALALVVLALFETTQALVAPFLAPTTADWEAAAREVRAGFRPGDLIVTAPGWADPLVRMHLGDLLTIPMAARMDDARYGRVWEISQRGSRAPEARGAEAFVAKFGRLTLRRLDRPAAQVTFDFLERWQEARVSRVDSGAVPKACPWQTDRFLCEGSAGVHRELVEVDTRIRRALLAPPVAAATTVIEFPSVLLGRELVATAGLHDVWARKYATGSVHFEIWIAGQRVGQDDIGNRSGWKPTHVDTRAQDGQSLPVRFEISSSKPELRHFSFAAEARR